MAEEVFAILKKHSFFNPVKFYSDFLTQNRFIKYTSESYKTGGNYQKLLNEKKEQKEKEKEKNS